MQLFALEQKCHYQGKYYKRDNLLNHLELDEGEGAAVDVGADSVGRDLGTVLKKSDTPGKKDDCNKRPAFRNLHFLQLQMPVPGECHTDVGDDKKQYCPKCLHIKSASLKKRANIEKNI